MQDAFFAKAKTMLMMEEGYVNRIYVDSTGHQTIGIGHNLSDVPVSDKSIEQIFKDDLAIALESAVRVFGDNWSGYTENRKLALVNLIFNLGETTLRDFKKTLAFIDAGDWHNAAANLLASKYAKQVPHRVKRVALMLKDDVFPYA